MHLESVFQGSPRVDSWETFGHRVDHDGEHARNVRRDEGEGDEELRFPALSLDRSASTGGFPGDHLPAQVGALPVGIVANQNQEHVEGLRAHSGVKGEEELRGEDVTVGSHLSVYLSPSLERDLPLEISLVTLTSACEVEVLMPCPSLAKSTKELLQAGCAKLSRYHETTSPPERKPFWDHPIEVSAGGLRASTRHQYGNSKESARI